MKAKVNLQLLLDEFGTAAAWDAVGLEARHPDAGAAVGLIADRQDGLAMDIAGRLAGPDVDGVQGNVLTLAGPTADLLQVLKEIGYAPAVEVVERRPPAGTLLVIAFADGQAAASYVSRGDLRN